MRHTRRALSAAKGQLQKAALKLLGYVAAVVLVLKLIPGLNQALSSLEQVRWQWVVGALAARDRVRDGVRPLLALRR